MEPTPKNKRVSLNPKHDGIAAELASLLENITADGILTNDEITALHEWVLHNRDVKLPAIDFLHTTLDGILADGIITPEERKALHQAIERVLPAELRASAKATRAARELLEKTHRKEEAAIEKERVTQERARNQPLYRLNFMVAGVFYEGRARIVDRFLIEGQMAFLARDAGNQFDSNAVEIRLREGYCIGYVPRDHAAIVGPLLDSGARYEAHCTKILRGGRIPIPVIEARLYRFDTTLDGLIEAGAAPIKVTPPIAAAKTGGCLSLLLVGAGLGLLLFVIIIAILGR